MAIGDIMGNSPTKGSSSMDANDNNPQSGAGVATSRSAAEGTSKGKTEGPSNIKTEPSSDTAKDAKPPAKPRGKADSGNSDDSKRKSSRQVRAPQTFVARPSKQGLSVEDGDRAFLEGQATTTTTTTPPARSSKKSPAASFGEEARKGPAGGAESTSRKRKRGEGESEKAAEEEEEAFVAPERRKSAISRRPRRLRPTEKILAMLQNEPRSEQKANPPKKQNASALSSKASYWQCAKCNRRNLQTKKRCGDLGCQSWRGGRRDYSPAAKEDPAISEGGSEPAAAAKKRETKSARAGERAAERTSGAKGDAGTTVGRGSAGASKKRAAAKPAAPTGEAKRASDTRRCKCGNEVEGNRARCGECQGRRGETREGLAKKSKKKTEKRSGVDAAAWPGVGSDGALKEGEAGAKSDGAQGAGVAPAVAGGDAAEVDEHYLDDVACCLCKCAVDYSDGFFFLPEAVDAAGGDLKGDTSELDNSELAAEVDKSMPAASMDGLENSKTAAAAADGDNLKPASESERDDNPTNNEIDNSKPVAAASSAETEEAQPAATKPKIDNSQPTATKNEIDKESPTCDTSAIVSSECSLVENGAMAMDVPRASPKTVIHRALGTDAPAANLAEHLLANDASLSADDAENAVVEEDDRKPSSTSKIPAEKTQLDDAQEGGSEYLKPPFQLPRRFHDPGNSLILCDGPEYGNRRKSSGAPQYKCERAYHQLCHFIPVFNVPRGAWRCLVCRYRDDEYLKRKASKGAKQKEPGQEIRRLSDDDLTAIFRMDPDATQSTDISSTELLFEVLSAPLKAKLLHAELTTRAKSLINTSLSNIRTAEHSIRAFTETSKARKNLMERIAKMGLPQELIQCFSRVAMSKRRIKDLIRTVEKAIKTRQYHDEVAFGKDEEEAGCIDAVSELMHWYANHKADDCDGALFRQMFPEGERTNARRRVEPRTDEANSEVDAASHGSGVSLGNLKCSCCFKGHASDENDLLLCDGFGCYRAYHTCCLEPKLTPEEVVADENDHWFCPLCTAHGRLIHYAQQEYLGDDFFDGSPVKEWENASDVFPEAEFESSVAQKLKDGIRDDDVNEFLSETLGMSLSLSHQSAPVEYPDDEDDESDEDFDSGNDEEEAEGSDEEDSRHEEQQLLKEKIDRDELDALSVCSDSEADGDGNKRGLRSRKRRHSAGRGRKSLTSDEEDSRSASPPSDAGKLDTANIVYGKRNRTKVDYRKLNDAMFGDESDDEAKGADVKFAYKPKAVKKRDSSSSDESDGEEESGDEDAKPAASASKANQAKAKSKRAKVHETRSQKSKASPVDKGKSKKSKASLIVSSNATNGDSWCCMKCGRMNLPSKKRCSDLSCQSWKGGVRENIRSPKRARS